MKKDYDILYEDDYLVVAYKDAGLLTIPDRYQHDKRNLASIMRELYGEIFIVHRIDRDTSGIILFAKDPDTHKALSQAFEDHQVDKTYLAIVIGTPEPTEGRIENFLAKSETVRDKIVVFKRGKLAITDYKVLESYDKKYCLVEVKILTGRTHQIRVHMAHIGHPLLVDNKYGKADSFSLSEIKRKKYNRKNDIEEKPLISRHTLHAAEISFTHPITQ